MRIKISDHIKNYYQLSSNIVEVCGADRVGVWIRTFRHNDYVLATAFDAWPEDFHNFVIDSNWPIIYLMSPSVLCERCYEG